MITRKNCRVCEGPLEPVLSLGELYVSDFPSPAQKGGTKAPLELVLCRTCSLLQLKHTVHAETMYQNYWYRSGTNKTMRDALADISRTVEKLMHLGKGDSVLDIGCNDGTLLASYSTPGLYKIGFDPARNMRQHSTKVASHVVTDFFAAKPFKTAPALKKHRPKVVTSIAMFYDLEDPGQFVADIKKVMQPEGLWVMQMSYLPLMLKENEFGNICHEHLEYYSLQSFEYLIDLHGLELVDVELNDINGGSIRTYVRDKNADPKNFGDEAYRTLAARRIQNLRNNEKSMKLADPETYREFAAWVDRIKSDVVGFIRQEVAKGKKVYVYGASTKGNTLLQYFGLDHKLIKGASERNADKWGKVTVGTRIPIVSEEQARKDKPDYFLVLPWHFLAEFKAREKDYLLSGGRFIMPMPHFTLI